MCVVARVLQRAVADDVVLWSRQSDDRTSLIKRSVGPVKKKIILLWTLAILQNEFHGYARITLLHTLIFCFDLSQYVVFLSSILPVTSLKFINLFKNCAPLLTLNGRGTIEDGGTNVHHNHSVFRKCTGSSSVQNPHRRLGYLLCWNGFLIVRPSVDRFLNIN